MPLEYGMQLNIITELAVLTNSNFSVPPTCFPSDAKNHNGWCALTSKQDVNRLGITYSNIFQQKQILQTWIHIFLSLSKPPVPPPCLGAVPTSLEAGRDVYIWKVHGTPVPRC